MTKSGQSLTATQVLRWSALGLGAIYGLTRQMSFNQQAKINASKREYEHKAELIEKAKAEFEAKQNPSKGDGSTDSQLPISPPLRLALTVALLAGAALGLQSDRGDRNADSPATVIRNPEDKNFDLEKYLNAVFAENK